MKLTDLTPNEYWQTDLIDLELGKAVQDAWHAGQRMAQDAHAASEQAAKAMADRYGGRAQC